MNHHRLAPPRMPMIPLLLRFVDDELARSADLIARTLAATVEQLRQPRDSLLSASERQHHFDLGTVLQQHRALYQRSFVDALRTLVTADMDPASSSSNAIGAAGLPSGTGGLQLMDETRVESDIEISRAIQQIDNVADWELRELQTFTSTLRGQEHVTAESNPLRPQSYARALWQAASAIPGAPPVQQAILLRISATVMAEFLKLAWAGACTRLEDQGVTPSIYRTVVYASNVGRPSPSEVDVTQPGALDGLLSSMPASAAAAGAPPATSHERNGATPALDDALRRVEALLRHLPPSGAAQPTASGPRLAEHRAALMASTAATIDRQVIELLSRLFETLLCDPLLQPAFRTVLARLQVSALRIALHDASMLESHEHPVWALMERIAASSAGAPHAQDARLISLLSFCEALVEDMLREPVQDAALYRRSLARLDEFLNESLRRAQREAQGSIDALRLAEQVDQMQQQVSARLVEQMVPIRTSAPIRRFVTGPWARVIAQAMLQFGDKSETAVAYMKTVDDLLWSLQLPDHPQSRQRLISLLPALLGKLREGMALIDLPAGEQQHVLDELMAVHTEALRPGSRTGATHTEPTLSPHDLVQRMLDEEIAPLEGPSFSDSLIDLASMDTVPAEWMPATVQSPGDDPQDWVQGMTPGQRYRIFLHGRWAQVQLLWRSERGQFLLFTGDAPGQTHSITQRALERLRAAKLLNTADTHSLIQRAVDGMLRGLASA